MQLFDRPAVDAEVWDELEELHFRPMAVLFIFLQMVALCSDGHMCGQRVWCQRSERLLLRARMHNLRRMLRRRMQPLWGLSLNRSKKEDWALLHKQQRSESLLVSVAHSLI